MAACVVVISLIRIPAWNYAWQRVARDVVTNRRRTNIGLSTLEAVLEVMALIACDYAVAHYLVEALNVGGA